MKTKGVLCVILLGMASLTGSPLHAQDPQESSSARELAVGAHFGLPTGISMKLETARQSYDLLLAWNLSDFFVAEGHVWLLEESFDQEPRLRYYAGPGLIVQAGEGQLRTGFSALGGILFRISRFEFFAQVSPLLEIVPTTQGGINTGAGFRIFL